jgi:hypothetical protein
LRATFADPASRHHEAVAEAELDVEYSGSPIVAGDPDAKLAAGQRLPDTIPVGTIPVGTIPVAGTRVDAPGPSLLHELTHRAGHTLLLVGGPSADRAEFASLLAALRAATTGSAGFDAVVGLSAASSIGVDGPGPDGRLDADAADRLGVGGVTLFAVRPDGYVGLRADHDHLDALSHYRSLLHLLD